MMVYVRMYVSKPATNVHLSLKGFRQSSKVHICLCIGHKAFFNTVNIKTHDSEPLGQEAGCMQ